MSYMIIEDIDGAIGVLVKESDTGHTEVGGEWEVLCEVDVNLIKTFLTIEEAEQHIEQEDLYVNEIGFIKPSLYIHPHEMEIIIDNILLY